MMSYNPTTLRMANSVGLVEGDDQKSYVYILYASYIDSFSKNVGSIKSKI